MSPNERLFDAHLNGQHSLTFYAHGPEWAFVIPHADNEALLDVVKICSGVWNGAGALILAANVDGRLLGDWKRYVGTRPLDETWLHPSLTAAARKALEMETSLGTIEWGRGHGFDALHPTQLIATPSSSDNRLQMTAPRFASPKLQRAADVIWGVMQHPLEWTDYFDFGRADNDFAFQSLVGGQLGFNMVSPLRLGQVSMDVFGQWDGQPWPYLWVFDTSEFDELVAFWNFRSGASASNRFVSVIGIPREALAHPRLIDALPGWIAHGSTDPSLTPSILAKVSPETAPELEAALSAVGIDRLPSGEKRRGSESQTDNQRPTWLPWEPVPNGRIVRGAVDQVAFSAHDGTALVMLPRPRGYRPRGGARLVLQSPPTPLPVTQTAAARIFIGGVAHPRGLAVNMATASPWWLPLQLPDQQTALEDWASDHGYTVEEPPPGMDARALLQRLGDLKRLDALAHEARLEVLVKLAPSGRDQLVKKLANAFAPTGDRAQLAEELIAKLRDEGFLLELAGQTVEQLKSALPQYKLAEIVAAIAPLVEAGFVQRGRHAECPRCAFAAFLALSELDEHVQCRGCGLSYLLPISAAGGKEALTAYRLDSLMARIIDRHVLPVILTLRALRDPARFPTPAHIWPGMLFKAQGGSSVDVDLLASNGSTVFAAECKVDGRRLDMTQLSRLLAFTDRVGATPVVAALAGDFSHTVRHEVEKRDGLVLVRADLLTAGRMPT